MYDYVIVGAGSAGCVLANRLTENPYNRVLLLEAGGPDSDPAIPIPAAFAKLFKSSYDWAYYTEEQPHLKNRRQYWPRGKVLGGSSSINAMVYSRGNPWDYDHWYELGNEGWKYADVLPYFKKAEHQERGESEYHGVGGPLCVSDLPYVNPLSRAFVEAGRATGLIPNLDFNGDEQQGIGLFQATRKQGRRHSAATAYLVPALPRPNLTALTQAHVTRILLDKRRATGVEYVHDGETQQVNVNKEVVLCGGAVNSPQLLLMSGIGPAAHLRDLGIEVVIDLPGVGENLQDHPAVGIARECTQPITMDVAETPDTFEDYQVNEKGPLTSNIIEAGAFIKTKPGVPAPDVEIVCIPVYFIEHGFENPAGHGFSLGSILLRPESRGRLTLSSADPFAPPIIKANYFAEESDFEPLIAAIKLIRKIVKAEAFAPFRGDEVLPGPNVQSDEQIRDYIIDWFQTCYHPAGTCKMGTDPMSVVDPTLRVHGIEGLRVADASIMPTVISGHTNAPTIMIGEKAADLIIRS